jgi:hypothetical protein
MKALRGVGTELCQKNKGKIMGTSCLRQRSPQIQLQKIRMAASFFSPNKKSLHSFEWAFLNKN